MLKRSKKQGARLLLARKLLAALSALAVPGLSWGQEIPAQVLADVPQPRLARAVISEVRAYGPGGAEDSFIELCNTTDEPLDLSGWSVQFRGLKGAAVTVVLAPATIALPRGHLLLAGRRYSLSAYAKPDLPLPEPIAGGVCLRDAAGLVVDAVGPQWPDVDLHSASTWHEGRGLPTWAFAPESARLAQVLEPTAQFSCVRRRGGGQVRDTNDNARDWIIASVSGTLSGHVVRLGAPGPQNRDADRLDDSAPSSAADFNTKPASLALSAVPEQSKNKGKSEDNARQLAPLRDRGDVGANHRLGTLVLRCRLVNASGQAMRRFQLHVVGVTAGAAPSGLADVRLLPLPLTLKPGAVSEAVPSAKGAEFAGVAPILYGALDEPPTQPRGGGFNSSLTFDAGTRSIAPGASVELRVHLGVQKLGRYRLALDGGGLQMVFNGRIQASKVEARADASWRTWTGWGSAPVARARTELSLEQSSRPSPNIASNTEHQGWGTEQTALASIILEGNTRDEDQDLRPAEKSPLELSSSEVVGTSSSIRLRFMGSLDARSVLAGAAFTLTVNGAVVEATPSIVGQNVVLLRLPEGSLPRGARVSVRWDNLRDLSGRLVSGHIGPLTVP